MVRRKNSEEEPAPKKSSAPKKISSKQTKKREVSVEDAVEATTMKMKKRKGGGKLAVALVMVAVLLGVGWFTTQWLLTGNNGNVLSGLFDNQTELIGEEEGRVNFVLLGNPGAEDYDGTRLTDTIMVASYDVENDFLNMFSIPRDMYVPVPSGGFAKANAVYEIGEDKNNDGPGEVIAMLEEILEIEIPYYMRIDFEGFTKVVDELGGVTVTVDRALSDPFYPGPNFGYQLVEFDEGTYTMDGDTALKYVRSRQTTSDFDRARRQQGMMVALRDKAMDLELLTAPTKAFEILDVLASHFDTNLSRDEFERVMKLVLDFDSANVANKVFDDSPAGLLYGTRVDNIYVLKPVDDDYTKLASFVEDALSSGSELEEVPAVVEEPLKLEVLNGTNVTGLAGGVADKLADLNFDIVRVGNNPTRGFDAPVIYDNTDGKKFSSLKRLAEILGATISQDEISLPANVEARLVVGTSSENFTQ